MEPSSVGPSGSTYSPIGNRISTPKREQAVLVDCPARLVGVGGTHGSASAVVLHMFRPCQSYPAMTKAVGMFQPVRTSDEAAGDSEFDASQRCSCCALRLSGLLVVLLLLLLSVVQVGRQFSGFHRTQDANGSSTGPLQPVTGESWPTSLYTQNHSSPGVSVELLDPLVQEWRLTGSLPPRATDWFPSPRFQATCNCVASTLDSCCHRVIARSHKMGYEWSLQLAGIMNPLLKNLTFGVVSIQQSALRPYPNETDWLAIVMVRNIYSALVSGYLYHKEGKECWQNSYGQTIDPVTGPHYHPDWRNYITTIPADELEAYDSICHLMAQTPVEVGLRVYIEWVFRDRYLKHGIFEHLMLTKFLPWVRDRTRIACFEDVTIRPLQTTVEEWMQYFYPGSSFDKEVARPLYAPMDAAQADANYSGGHATTHDPTIRLELVRIIRDLDGEFFDGQIAWIDSMVPCGR